jgi:hypothetical protein
MGDALLVPAYWLVKDEHPPSNLGARHRTRISSGGNREGMHTGRNPRHRVFCWGSYCPALTRDVGTSWWGKPT